MSLPANALWNRYAEINIGGRLFTSPPFSIEFSQTLKTGRLTQTKAKLYNPSRDTIKAAEPVRKGRTWVYNEVVISAGFDDDYGTAVLGKIHDFRVIKKSPDIVLELTIGDATSIWANSLILKTWSNTPASLILAEILAEVGIIPEISLGVDKIYRTFTARTLRGAVRKIAADTDSTYYFRNGIFRIIANEPAQTRTVLYISPESGLLDKIEKKRGGYKFKTLFFYKIQMGDIVQIEDKNTPVATVRIRKGNKKFSSFGKSECVFEAVEI